MSEPATNETTTRGAAVSAEIAPCRDAAELRRYIDQYWRPGHVLARDERMFNFQYATPWVDRAHFPDGISVLGVYENDQMLGFLGAITAPYPCPRSYWLALWHVRPELKGTGMGGRLLQTMQEIAEDSGGWIGTFGAGPEALPVYLKRGYTVRAVRRWIFDPTSSGAPFRMTPPNTLEQAPSEDWIAYRYLHHPLFTYERRGGCIVRSEQNAWGTVCHLAMLGEDWPAVVPALHEELRQQAAAADSPFLLDCWAFNCPGRGWTLAPDDLPTVFHPPQPRGNLIYAVGRPFIPARVEKGDCDQDRPN